MRASRSVDLGRLVLVALFVGASDGRPAPSHSADVRPARTVAVTAAGDILILVSGRAAAYQHAEEGVREAMSAVAARRRVLTMPVGQEEDAGRALEAMASTVPALVVAIGTRAAMLARRSGLPVPVVYAMVLDPASIGLPAPGQASAGGITGVAMDVTCEQQLTLLIDLVPALRRVGVIYDPAISGETIRRGAVAARALGIELVAQPVRSQADVIEAADVLAGTVDALWAIPDQTVLTEANTRALILLALRARVPLLAISEGYVRHGAFAALAADPREVGRRAGEMASKILAGSPTDQIRPEMPPRLSLYLNRATAARLGVTLPEAALTRARAVYPQGAGGPP